MPGELKGSVREFPTRLILAASVVVSLSFLLIIVMVLDGQRRAGLAADHIRMAQSVHVQLSVLHQEMSSMRVMASATGDLRWAARYTEAADKMSRL